MVVMKFDYCTAYAAAACSVLVVCVPTLGSQTSPLKPCINFVVLSLTNKYVPAVIATIAFETTVVIALLLVLIEIVWYRHYGGLAGALQPFEERRIRQ